MNLQQNKDTRSSVVHRPQVADGIDQDMLDLLSSSALASEYKPVAVVNRPNRDIAAVYTRFSSAIQLEASTERQREAAFGYANARGMIVPDELVFSDEAKSGTSMVGRDRLDALLRAAERGDFHYVIIEHSDRLARDVVDAAELFKELSSRQIELHSVSLGRAMGWSDVALLGFLSQEQRRLMIDRMLQGRRFAVQDGRLPSNPCYGYERDPAARRGNLRVNTDQAEVVRRIHRDFDAGLIPNDIAVTLNRESVPSPSGRRWKHDAVRTVLSTVLYRGLVTDGRCAHFKDAGGARRRARRDPSEWNVKHVPRLQLVDDQTWSRNQDRLSRRSSPRPNGLNRKPRLLTARLLCSACGENLWMATPVRKGRPIPTTAQCSGIYAQTCDEVRTFSVEALERAVVGAVRRALDGPETAARYATALAGCVAGAKGEAEGELERIEVELARLRRALDASWEEALEARVSTDVVREQRRSLVLTIQELEGKAVGARQRCRASEPDVSRWPDWQEVLNDIPFEPLFTPRNGAEQRVYDSLRELVSRVVVTPRELTGFDLVIFGPAASFAPSGTEAGEPYIEASYRPTGRDVGSPAERRARATELAADASLKLTDAEWLLVSPLLPRTMRILERRTVADALVFLLRSRLPMSWLDDSFGPPRIVERTIRRIERRTVSEIATVLKDHDPERNADLHTEVTKWTGAQGPVELAAIS